jgi:hypothetical protein
MVMDCNVKMQFRDFGNYFYKGKIGLNWDYLKGHGPWCKKVSIKDLIFIFLLENPME